MKHSEKYHFADFTHDHYRALLESMMSNYTIRTYTDFKRDESFCILRHDIDLSLEAALEIARIEAEAGVCATYFLHFHNEWYNLMEASSARLVKSILELGHQIALHFDAHFYVIDSAESLESRLGHEKDWIEQLFGVQPQVFSFHNPTDYILSFEASTYGGMLSTYSHYFKTQVGYCSDSNGIWRHARMADFIASKEHPRIQILTHPGWWTEQAESPKRKVTRIAEDRASQTLRQYEEMLKNFGRLNIDWD